jgi:hypothetical protein
MLVHVVMSKFVGGCIAGEACLPLVITQLGWWSGVSELCSTCLIGRLCRSHAGLLLRLTSRSTFNNQIVHNFCNIPQHKACQAVISKTATRPNQTAKSEHSGGSVHA